MSKKGLAISTVQFSDECINEVSGLLSSLRDHKENYPNDQEEDLNVVMNALVAKNAESYYREMMSDEKSWNTRDYHMVEAIQELRIYYGEETKIILWEHNTHIGDASETSMKSEQLINVGQIIREQYGSGCAFLLPGRQARCSQALPERARSREIPLTRCGRCRKAYDP